jgi:chemotaxis protein CheD
MATPERKGPPATSLSQRMAEARERTVAARVERQGPAQGPALLPSPMTSEAPPRGRPVIGGIKAPVSPPAPVPGRGGATTWELPARPGDQLMLLPGQMHFGGHAANVRTLLGSCVAVTLWHPQRRIGGMCHFLLPSRQRGSDEALDGRYGDEALDVMVARLRAARTEPHEYEAHLYGGADTMPEGSGVKFNVGERNIEQGWKLIDSHGFQLQGVDVGEDVPRTVTLNIATGQVEMKRGNGRAPATALPQHTPPIQAGKSASRRT